MHKHRLSRLFHSFSLSIFLIAGTSAHADSGLRAGLVDFPNWEDKGSDHFIKFILESPDKKKPLFVGEVHGTNEAQRLIAEIIDHAIRHEREVILGLEIPSQEQKSINTYLESKGETHDREMLLSGGFWRGFQDGRASEAMLGLIEHIRVQKSIGRKIRLVCLDGGARDDFGGFDRDKSMALAIRTAMKQTPNSLMVALVGNFHTRPLTLEDSKDNLVSHLVDLRAVVVNLASRRGAFWACQGSGCGVRPTLSGAKVKPNAARLEVSAQTDKIIFYRLELPRFTPSYPAVKNR